MLKGIKFVNLKGGDNIANINEYLLILSNGSEVFRVYSYNEKLAIQTFSSACDRYKNTTNKEYKEYWESIKSQIQDKSYTLIENTDFVGIRKV